jgi:hypothetical protein
LNWRTSPGIHCYHAAHQVRQGHTLVDSSLQAALREPVANLDRGIVEERLSPDLFWRHLVPLSAEFDKTRQLTEVLLTKLQGRVEAQIRIPRFERHLNEVREAFLKNKLKMTEIMLEPLQQAWNYQGAGLLSGVVNWTDEKILVDEAIVFVVPPVSGGGGAAHLQYNSARIEVVENSGSELPEIVRLAWLLSQLNLDLPCFGEKVAIQRLDRVASLAMIPVALAAAEALQMLICNQETIAGAMRTWLPPDHLDASITTVTQWWEVYQTKRPVWSAALQALDQLLAE